MSGTRWWHLISGPRRAGMVGCGLVLAGLLAAVQWTAEQERTSVEIASQFLFPAALGSETASTAFQRMIRNYGDAVIMEERPSLVAADEEAKLACSSLAAAQTLMAFDARRQPQVAHLAARVKGFTDRAEVIYTAGAGNMENLSDAAQQEFLRLAAENKDIQHALDALQTDLTGDFREKLARLRRLSLLQRLLEGGILLVVVAGGFFAAGAFIEIAAQKRADEALHQAYKENEVLLNSVPSLLIELSPDGRIRNWNHSATAILGWDEAKVRGQHLGQCGVEWLTPQIDQRVAAGLGQPGEHALGEVKFKKDHETRFLGLNVVALRNKDRAGSLVVGTDITKRTVLEAQLRQAQKLEAIGQLAAGIAHEINTPIQYVGDNCVFVRESWDSVSELARAAQSLHREPATDSLSAEARARLHRALAAADLEYLLDEVPKAIDHSLEGLKRVAKIVHAMKEFSHPGSEEKTCLDLNRAIETTITVARNEWKYVADLETCLDPGLLPVYCHAGEFNQVILNLMINAAHAIREVVGDGANGKGKILLTTKQLEDWVEISIADSGCGIPKEIQSRIFEPFFTTKPVGQGTGQGLALAHSTIVRRHGGRLWFETKPGRGTTFFIRLPIHPSKTEMTAEV